MRKASDTIFRLLALLQLIPVYPQASSASELREKLRGKSTEFEVDIRTIQRDLEKLSASFPLTCDARGRTNFWCWRDKHAFMQIPAMDQSAAFALKLASENLKPLIPLSTLRLLVPYFKHAAGVLQQTKLGSWPAKTRIVGRGPDMIAPPIKQGVQEVVYEALLEGKQIEVNYHGKGQGDASPRTLHPLGIVLKNQNIYLVATSWKYDDPRHYALHRMERASLSKQRAKRPAGFDLAGYVEKEKEFSYPVSGKSIKLRALFFGGAEVHLTESKLADDQKNTYKKDGRMPSEATVADTLELRWWLLGFGSQVEVVGPKTLREEFAEIVEEMGEVYND